MKFSATFAEEIILERIHEGPYTEYRIPGITVTPKGTLIICYEGRMSTHDDWAKIDTVVCRSTDRGHTWDKQRFTLPAEMGGSAEDTINNPTLIQEADKNTIHLIFHQNYARAFHCVSEDDGITWSAPAEITDAFRQYPAEWNVCATGPGHGVSLGEGRLIAPTWIANGRRIDDRRTAHQPSKAGTLLSFDSGRTWTAGALVDGVLNSNETSLAVLPDGRILANFRNCEEDYHRRLGLSSDGGKTFDRVWREDALPDPMCFAGMCAIPGGAAFVHCRNGTAHPENPRARIHTTLSVTADAGATWTDLCEVNEQGGYADIAYYEGEVYIIYEIDPVKRGEVTELVLARYRLDSVQD